LDRYFAVLAFDGDQIGKWVSGDFCAPGEEIQAWHRDVSDRLSDFALQCVRPIIEACDGRLIYSGGDDVLALLPSDTAVECARFLRLAYRGDPSFILELRRLAETLQANHKGAGRLSRAGHRRQYSPHIDAATKGTLFEVRGKSFVIPGSGKPLKLPGELRAGRSADPDPAPLRPDASVGIAIAHFKAALQDVIRAAQAAEKRAKNRLGRSAVSITLIKKSGETIEWGAKWDNGGVEAYRTMHAELRVGTFSSRLPYRLAALLMPHVVSGDGLASRAVVDLPGFNREALIEKESLHVSRQHRGPGFVSGRAENLSTTICSYARSLADASQIPDVIGLCQTVAFTLPAR